MDYLLLEKAKGRPVANSENYLRQIKASWPSERPDVNCWAGRLYCAITAKGAVTGCCDTLKTASGGGNGLLTENPVKKFYLLPPFQCSTCYASTPLEANIAMSMCVKNPLAAMRQVASFLPKHYWSARGR